MSKTDTQLEFIGTSRDDLSEFPAEVKYCIGFALRAAQKGGKHPDAKPLKGFKGASVLEIVSDFDGNTFRAVYTVKIKGVIYVLHAFQKKSKKGIATPKAELDKIKRRLKEAEEASLGERAMKKVRVTKSSGNVFADIGLPNAAEHSIKADLVLRIAARIRSKGLTQAKAASLLGLAQPDVSKLLRGHFAGYAYERLFGYLNALGERISIEVSQAKTKKDARLELEMAD
jgi:phage-related protein/predicted XRE-type DNA-binding protein